jgi:hypothetical protein
MILVIMLTALVEASPFAERSLDQPIDQRSGQWPI